MAVLAIGLALMTAAMVVAMHPTSPSRNHTSASSSTYATATSAVSLRNATYTITSSRTASSPAPLTGQTQTGGVIPLAVSQGTLRRTDTASFNMSGALRFYTSLMSPLGLEIEYQGAHSVWLADDQALDYAALLKIYGSTGNATALELARQINESMAVRWGGLFAYWNPIFEAGGSYPNDTRVMCGADHSLAALQGYQISATEFKQCPDFHYSQFSDQLAVRVLLDLHNSNYTGAESEFAALNATWDGSGFADQAFRDDPTHLYQSYKLATYVIAWRALSATPQTEGFASGYSTVLHSVEALMPRLQSAAGGVWTGYRFSNDGEMLLGRGVSLANGETTALFVLAYA